MIPSLSQEELTQYASNAQTIQEPTGLDYSQGAKAGKTVPAKWWNWLFSNVTKRVVQSRNDADNMLTELKNAVTDAGLTPSGSDNTQLAQAIAAKADAQINDYVLGSKVGFTCDWTQVPVIIDGQDYAANVRFVNSSVFLDGGNIFAYTRLYIDNINRGPFYSRDLAHWESISYFAEGSGVYLNGSAYMLNADYTQTKLYKVQASNPTDYTTIYSNTTQPNADNYLPFTTVVDNALYLFTHRGELYRVNQDDTVTLIDAPLGLGQSTKSQDTRYNPQGLYVQSTIIGGKTFVGNIEVADNVWTPLYTSTSAYMSVTRVKVKQLHNGNIAFIAQPVNALDARGPYKIMDTSGTLLEGVTDVFCRISAEANDLLFAKTDDTITFSADGLSFTAVGSIIYPGTTLGSVVQLQDKYFIVSRTIHYYRTLVVTKDFVTFNESIPPAGTAATGVSLYVDGKHVVLDMRHSGTGQALASYLIGYDEALVPIKVVCKAYDGAQTVHSYYDIQTHISAIAGATAVALIGTNPKLFKSVRTVNSVVGHTLYLR